MLMLHAWPGVIYGPRHYYTFLPVIIVLSMLGLRFMLRKARSRWHQRGGSFVLLIVSGLFAITLLLYIPEVVKSSGYPNLMSGLIHTSPFMDGEYIFCAHQVPDEDLAMMAAFHDRTAYLFWWDGEISHLEPWSLELAGELEPAGEFQARPVIGEERTD